MLGGVGRFFRKLGRGADKALDAAADLARALRGILPGRAKTVADAVIVVDEAVDAIEGPGPDPDPKPKEGG